MKAGVLLPLAIDKYYSYGVPEELQDKIQVGKRVEVQFGRKKLYSGVVAEISEEIDPSLKPIISLIDEKPILDAIHLKFWDWIANYYACSIGEVMIAALPSFLKLSSETIVMAGPAIESSRSFLDDKGFMIAEALSIQQELTIEDIQKITNTKTVYPYLQMLFREDIIQLKENLVKRYKPKLQLCVRLNPGLEGDEKKLVEALDSLKRAPKQQDALLGYIQIKDKEKHTKKSDVAKVSGASNAVITALVNKNIFEYYTIEVSRLGSFEAAEYEGIKLSPEQLRAYDEIKAGWENKSTVLLHGVTGSGKTLIYKQLISEVIKEGKQVLYLLPEIALTTQLIRRLQRVFGKKILVYHSKMNNAERSEAWESVHNGKPVVLCARSGIFLPFTDLGLIIVDEEHDPSYKQYDPAPRYNARDLAAFLAQLHKAKQLIGSATPSLESYYNVQMEKYAYVKLDKRYGDIKMPHIHFVDLGEAIRKRKMKGHFSIELMDEIDKALQEEEQVILFQNRRGYAPIIFCKRCTWVAKCVNCDVSLSFHKYLKQLKCHYCGFTQKPQEMCPDCGSHELELRGFGTQQLEEELANFYPNASIGRLDYDTARGKQAHERIIHRFEEQKIDILIGTQMVTKGLDFDHVSLVGVLHADLSLHFPDFRSAERTFQLLTQVSGRSGRKGKQGKVVIQAYAVQHPIMKEIATYDYASFADRELNERRKFYYPPFVRIIELTLKHRKLEVLQDGSKLFGKRLKDAMGGRVMGPSVPPLSRVKNQYQMQFLIKLEKNAKRLWAAKRIIAEEITRLKKERGLSTVRVIVDVDPY